MPTYKYMCVECGEFEVWESIHADPMDRHDCGEVCARVFSIPNISVMATPNKAPEARAAVAREARWGVDMPAYKRLRMNGVQPPRIDGAAELETRAETKTEIERGRISTLNRIIDREGIT